MIQRISPPLLTGAGEGKSKGPRWGGAVERRKELRGRGGRNIKESRKGSRSHEPNTLP